jgi:DNA-binding CsgD family transcriptional regulator
MHRFSVNYNTIQRVLPPGWTRACRSRPIYVILILKIFPLLQASLFSQGFNLGNVPVVNYNKKAYQAGTQNWKICQDKSGSIYAANNNGLLEFNGQYWRLWPLSNGTIARSAVIAEDGKIFVGGQGEVGFFQPGKSGELVYHSLCRLLDVRYQRFEDVWDIVIRKEGVYFRTNKEVFRYRGGRMEVIHSGPPLVFMAAFGPHLLIQHASADLFVLDSNSFKPTKLQGLEPGALLSAILPVDKDSSIVTTIGHGIYSSRGNRLLKWSTGYEEFLRVSKIAAASLLPDGSLAVGTTYDGLLLFDKTRRVLQHLNKSNGLQNNTVLSTLADRSGNLWLGLDNGIDYAAVNSPFTYIYPDGINQGTGYAAAVHDERIYFGTNQGLYVNVWKEYYSPAEQYQFRNVLNAKGQVWSLSALGKHLLMGSHNGAMQIKQDRAEFISKNTGVWTFQPISEQLAVVGHYSGMSLLRKKQNDWHFEGELKGISESCRILALDQDKKVWVSHPYRGVFQLAVDSLARTVETTFYDVSRQLPSNLNNYVFKLAGELVFATEDGIYSFQNADQCFRKNHLLNEFFSPIGRVKFLKEDGSGNIWYVAGDETGVIWVEDEGLKKAVRRMPVPELSDKLVGGFEFILPLSPKHVFFATDQGFIHLDAEKYMRQERPPTLLLNAVSTTTNKDSLLFGGHLPAAGQPDEPRLSHRDNNIRFDYSSTDYDQAEFTTYAFLLEGYSMEWSSWQKKSFAEFNNLRHGDYVFRVKARNKHGLECQERSFPFTIKAPWYASPFAIAIYFLCFWGLIAVLFLTQRRSYEQEKAMLQTTHRQKEAEQLSLVKQSEIEIARLRSEKLSAEINHRNRELATTTMHLVQKSELIGTIRQALERMKPKTTQQPELYQELEKLIRRIESDTRMDEDWENFSRYFDEVHTEFLKKLGEKFPNLNPSDFKLCAYLRMNLSSKEIATLMNISVRGVETSRYRLRKRLGLASDVNLTEFLLRL